MVLQFFLFFGGGGGGRQSAFWRFKWKWRMWISAYVFKPVLHNYFYHNSLPNTGVEKLVSMRPSLARSAELGLVTPEGLSTKLGISTA